MRDTRHATDLIFAMRAPRPPPPTRASLGHPPRPTSSARFRLPGCPLPPELRSGTLPHLRWWRGERKLSSPLPRSGGGASTGRQAGAQRRGHAAEGLICATQSPRPPPPARALLGHPPPPSVVEGKIWVPGVLSPTSRAPGGQLLLRLRPRLPGLRGIRCRSDGGRHRGGRRAESRSGCSAR